MYFFTADQHFDHTNIIAYCNRPFEDVDDMNNELIKRWNEIVGKGDTIIVAGDLSLHVSYKIVHEKFISKLNGNKIFLKGNHDYWLKEKRYLWHKKIEGQMLAVGHYPMRSWHNSIHGSWNLHGHSHGLLSPLKNQLDIGVDVHRYYPVPFENLKHYF